MANNEVTKTIWGGLMSSTTSVGGIDTMRQHATSELSAGSPAVANSTDLSRAAATGTTLGASIPTNDAKSSLSDNISNGNLVTTLNAFLSLYSQVRVFTFHRNRTSWGTYGNSAAVTPDYTRTAYKTSPAVSTPNDAAPVGAYDNIAIGDGVDLSDYEAIINTLKGVITTNSSKSDVTVNYCHSSCHNVCHGSRGRR